jgi:hypothetical protein
MRKTMINYLQHKLGEDWKMVFNVDDYGYLLEDYLEEEVEEIEII